MIREAKILNKAVHKLSLSMCVCVCVCVRERERQRQRETKKDRISKYIHAMNIFMICRFSQECFLLKRVF